MGRIKTKLIKRAAHRLFVLHKKDFKEDFEYNKGKVTELADLNSYKLRNTIAGLLTKLVKKDK
jgi:small subunit ribosomal protein S17e